MQTLRAITGTFAVILILLVSYFSAGCEASCERMRAMATPSASANAAGMSSEMADMTDCGSMDDKAGAAGHYLIGAEVHLCQHDEAVPESAREWQPSLTTVVLMALVATPEPPVSRNSFVIPATGPPPGPLTTLELSSIQRV